MMRNLQILPEIPPIAANSGMRLIAVSYEVSKSPYFETRGNEVRDEEAIIVSNLEDTVNLNAYYVDIENLTEDTEIYARYKLHYEVITSNGTRKTEGPWSRVVAMRADQEGFKVSDVILATPQVYVERIRTNNKNVLKLTCSLMKVFIGYGEHKSTTWRFKSSDGKILFERKRSKELLLELQLPFDNFDYNRTYIVECQHHSTTNADSLPGTVIYNEALNHQDYYMLNIESELVSGRDLLTSVILHFNKFVSIDLMLKNSKEVIVAESFNNKNLNPKLRAPELKPNEPYSVYSRVQFEPGRYTDWRLDAILLAKANTALDITPNIPYESNYVYNQKIIQPGVKHLYSKELLTGGFLLPKSDTNVFKGLGYYRIEGGQLVFVNDITGTESIGDNKPLSNYSVNVIPLYNGEVIINRTELSGTKDKQGIAKSVFLKYSVDTTTATFEYLGSANPVKQLGSTAVSGSAVATIDNNVYFVPAREGTSKTPTNLCLYKLNTEDMTISKVNDLPFEATQFVSLCLIGNDEFLVLGGMKETTEANPKDWVRTNDNIYKYNTKTNTFVKIADFTEINIPKWYNLHAVTRKDGRVVVFNNSEGAGVAEDQSIVLIDHTLPTAIVTKQDNDFADGRVYIRTLVENNGNIYRISSSPYEPQEIYLYKVKGYPSVSIGEADIQTSVVTELVVPENKTIIIDNPYKYTRITIGGSVEAGTSGTLVWLSKNTKRVYQADTFFVTKSMLLYEDNVDELTRGRNYKNIIMLDGVDISISDANAPTQP